MQSVGNIAGALRPLGGLLGEALQNGVFELLVDVEALPARRLRYLVHDAVENGLHLAGKRRPPREAFVQHRAERVDVAAVVEFLAGDLFRAHVAYRPDDHARLRELARRDAREAEVHDTHAHAPRLVARDHDVFGLDVAVHDPV